MTRRLYEPICTRNKAITLSNAGEGKESRRPHKNRGGITMSTVDFLQPNYTNGLEVRKIKEAYEEIAKEMAG